MAKSDFIEFSQEKDDEICPEAWAEDEVDLQEITVGQFTEYMEVMEKIRTLQLEYLLAQKSVGFCN